MSLTIDANLWLAAGDPAEPSEEVSSQFLLTVVASNETIESPLLLQVEIAGAAARKTRNAEDALRFVHEVSVVATHTWHVLDGALAASASALASRLFLRGADAVYVAVAALTGSTLITLDRELIRRSASVIPVLTPQVWLEMNRG